MNTFSAVGLGGLGWYLNGTKNETVKLLSHAGPCPGITLVITGAVIGTFSSVE